MGGEPKKSDPELPAIFASEAASCNLSLCECQQPSFAIPISAIGLHKKTGIRFMLLR